MLLLMESADYKPTDELIGGKWEVANLDHRTHNGLECIRHGSSDELRLHHLLGSNESATVIVGWRMSLKWNNSGNDEPVLTLNGDDGSVRHLSMWHNNDGSLTVARGDGTELGTSAGAAFPNQTWCYIEVKFTCDDTNGQIEVWVDNVKVIDGIGVGADTRNGGADALIDSVKFGAGNTNYHYQRDIVILNDAGSAPWNDRIGPCKVRAMKPNGAGNYAEWTPDSGNNHERVDETSPTGDGDTSYVEATSTGLRDSYAFEDWPEVGDTPAAVAIQAAARYDAAPLDFALFVRRSGTDDDGTAEAPPAGYAVSHYRVLQEDPVAAGPWTESNLNSSEFGVVT